MAESDLDDLLSIPARFHTSGRSVADLFADVDPSAVADLAAIESRLAASPELVEFWQTYSYDKRSSPSPYLDGLEVGLYDAGRHDVRIHQSLPAACADFIVREWASIRER